MVKKLLKKPAKASPAASGPLNATQSSKITAAGKITTESNNIEVTESRSLKVFDVPLSLVDEFEGNPNEQDERVFDELVERIRKEGSDEPIIIVPSVKDGAPTGRYTIVSGHHRAKACKAAGLTHVPAVIREGWDEDRVAIEVITRNNLRGNINPYKFTELFDRLQKRYDKAHLQKMTGLSDKKRFNALYKKISDNLTPKQKKKLDEAKETVNSIEDLNAVLHNIFKEHGRELDYGFMVFNFGGKKHHYIRIDDETNKDLEAIEAHFEKHDASVAEAFKELVEAARAKLLSGNVAKPQMVPKTSTPRIMRKPGGDQGKA